jgi:hypothetical protein
MTSLDKKSFFIPILLGIIFFYLVVGLGPLDPQNLSWIFGRFDPPQHYLGWVFYRNSPWSFPIGLNPNYGIDIGNSIVYTDSLPLLAIPLKLISPLLPKVFQYIGIWLLICFVMQAYFSWKIISIASNNFWILLFGTALLAFSPPMFWRAYTPSGTQAALAAHFLILATFYLILKKDQTLRTIYWGALLLIGSLTHFYLFAMVAILWISDLLDQAINKKTLAWKQASFEIISIFAIVLVCAWQAGYFAISSSSGVEQGYGFLKLNLLSPLDPNGWSFVLPNIPIQTTWGEGFNYLGLGIILAILLSLCLVFFSSIVKNFPILKNAFCLVSNHRFLLIALLLLLLNAITNNVGVGAKEFAFELPAFLHTPLNILRSSARMYWPIHYGLIICALFIIIKLLSTKKTIAILGILLAIQIVDTSHGWLTIRQNLAQDMSHEVHSPLLKDPFWQSAAKFYKKIIRIPAGTQTLNWLKFATLAAENEISTNSIYLARIDNQQVNAANSKLLDVLKNGNYDPSTLYILEQRFIIPALATIGPDDMLAHIDDFTVLAPGWLKCKACPQISEEKRINTEQLRPSNRSLTGFSSQAKDQQSIFYLGNGWSWQEDWGTWSDGAVAAVNIPWPKQTPRTLKIDLKAFVMTDKLPTQSVDILVNSAPYTHLELNEFDNNSLVIPITKEMLTQPFLKVEFKINNPGQPSKLISGNKDQRKLGLGLKSIYFD